ncbi:MAG: ACT domain-containing protein [Clostridia bacterium]|nr:ACT domain-containing protein [Oscillospiraceae bacterium]MBQ7960383.1 ACT domain-containing protein [Clostridia bacterium]
MFVKQISVFVENKPGQLGKITKILAEEKIDIRAFSVADTVEFGILRLIVKEPDRAAELLRNAGFTAQMNEVIVAVMKDKLGAFDEIVMQLASKNIDVQYVYSFIGEVAATGRVAIRTDNMNEAFETLEKSGITLSTQEDI